MLYGKFSVNSISDCLSDPSLALDKSLPCDFLAVCASQDGLLQQHFSGFYTREKCE